MLLCRRLGTSFLAYSYLLSIILIFASYHLKNIYSIFFEYSEKALLTTFFYVYKPPEEFCYHTDTFRELENAPRFSDAMKRIDLID